MYPVSGTTEVIWRAAAAVLISEGDLYTHGFFSLWPQKVSLPSKMLYNVVEIMFYLDQICKSCDLS